MASTISTAGTIVDEYATWLRSWGASQRTIDARVGLARSRLLAWGIEGVTAENIAGFLARPDIKPWTRSTYHANLTCFCAWLVATGHREENPMVAVRKPKRPAPRPRPLTESEVARVLSVVEGSVRDWILLALLAGLRASEIAKIRGEDVTADGIYVIGKGGKAETLPCHDDLWAMAERYPQRGYWFPGPDDGHLRSQQISLIVGKLFHAMGIDGSIHRCRHVYGTRLLRAGENIRIVQKLMRHSNLDTTASYTAVDEDELRAAINRLSAAPRRSHSAQPLARG
jgi:integrase/recombinase XerD